MTLGEATLQVKHMLQELIAGGCLPSGRVTSLSWKGDLGGTSPGLPQLVTVANIYCSPYAGILKKAFYAHHLIKSHLLPLK